jgi:hypothetical protein
LENATKHIYIHDWWLVSTPRQSVHSISF